MTLFTIFEQARCHKRADRKAPFAIRIEYDSTRFEFDGPEIERWLTEYKPHSNFDFFPHQPLIWRDPHKPGKPTARDSGKARR